MSMIEQMVETRTWQEFRGITENSQYRFVWNNKRQCTIFWLDAKY